MTEFNRVFLDTPVFIYFLEDNKQFGDQVSQIFQTLLKSNVELISSVITYMEFCVRPFELNKYDLVDKFKEFLKDLDIFLFDINFRTADLAAQLRSKYKSLRGMDAMQIATAVYSNCDIFITNDQKLKDIIEIEIKLLTDWKMD